MTRMRQLPTAGKSSSYTADRVHPLAGLTSRPVYKYQQVSDITPEAIREAQLRFAGHVAGMGYDVGTREKRSPDLWDDDLDQVRVVFESLGILLPVGQPPVVEIKSTRAEGKTCRHKRCGRCGRCACDVKGLVTSLSGSTGLRLCKFCRRSEKADRAVRHRQLLDGDEPI